MKLDSYINLSIILLFDLEFKKRELKLEFS
jgi:hypothetical protein